MTFSLRFALLCCLLGLSTPLRAQLFTPMDEVPLPPEEGWPTPPAPKDENLLAFDPNFNSPLSFFVDTASLNVGGDRIVRYTLVIKSGSGGANVFYEGLRCDTGDRKIHAYGKPDGTWSLARDPQWKPAAEERYRRTLFNYFCPRNSPIRTPAEGMNAIRSGIHPNLIVH